MKFQDPIMHGSQYVRGIKIVRNRKQICPVNFFKVGGIPSHEKTFRGLRSKQPTQLQKL